VNRVPESAGDHLLVNKHVFALRRPRRWEMIVFNLFGKSFIKRLIGLPGEWLEILDGDVYVDHQLARKTFAEFKAVCIPVFDNNFQPSPHGWRDRWEVVSAGPGPHPVAGTELHLDALHSGQDYQLVTYRHFLLDEHKCEPIRDEYGYNGGDPVAAEAVHDFMVECDIEVMQGNGAVLCGLTDGYDQVVAEFPVWGDRDVPREMETRLWQRGAPASPPLSLSVDAAQIIGNAPGASLQAGRRYHVELAFVDRRATLTVDGAALFPPVDLPAVANRPGVVKPAFLGARGVKLTVRNFRLLRDIHYTQAGRNAVQGKGVRLEAGQYFVLGDNSPNSEDSRYWPDRGTVPARNLLGKPFLVHMPSRITSCDFLGRHGLCQEPDWERIRWLH
jgi:signal peptidase I